MYFATRRVIPLCCLMGYSSSQRKTRNDSALLYPALPNSPNCLSRRESCLSAREKREARRGTGRLRRAVGGTYVARSAARVEGRGEGARTKTFSIARANSRHI